HLQKTAVVEAILTDKNRLDRRLHVVVDAPGAGALEEGERPVMGIEHHLLSLARIGSNIKHPTVAQPNMGDLDGDRRSIEQHNFVAPVELIGFARCKAERHEGARNRCRAHSPPAAGIAAYRIIATLVAQPPKLLEYPNMCQALARRLTLIGLKQSIQFSLKRADPWQRLTLSLVGKRGLARAQNLAHRIPRNVQLSTDLLDRLPLHEMGTPYPCDRIHALHPPTTHPHQRKGSLFSPQHRGSILDAYNPQTGVNIPCRMTNGGQYSHAAMWVILAFAGLGEGA